MKSTRSKQSGKTPVKKSPARSAAKSGGKKSGSQKPIRKKGSAQRGSAPTKKKHAAKPVKTVVKNKIAAPKPLASPSPIVAIVLRAMDDMKAVNITTLDVRGVTDIADHMVIASGNSDRHVRAIADRVREFAKQAGYRPMGVEGERDGEWVLVDLNDVIVHVMLPRVREFYRLESLWDVTAARREAVQG